jgi:hypothetical protein
MLVYFTIFLRCSNQNTQVKDGMAPTSGRTGNSNPAEFQTSTWKCNQVRPVKQID